MAVASRFLENKRYMAQYTRDVTATYTAKVGATSDGFIADEVINIEDPAADFTITVPNGEYLGQMLIIVLESNDNSKTVTITTTTGDDNTLDTAGDFGVYRWVGATSGWQYVHGEVAS